MLVFGEKSDAIRNDYPKSFYDLLDKIGWSHYVHEYRGKRANGTLEKSVWKLEDYKLIIEIELYEQGKGNIRLKFDEHKRVPTFPDSFFAPRQIGGTIFNDFEKPIEILTRMVREALKREQIERIRFSIVAFEKILEKVKG